MTFICSNFRFCICFVCETSGVTNTTGEVKYIVTHIDTFVTPSNVKVYSRELASSIHVV